MHPTLQIPTVASAHPVPKLHICTRRWFVSSWSTFWVHHVAHCLWWGPSNKLSFHFLAQHIEFGKSSEYHPHLPHLLHAPEKSLRWSQVVVRRMYVQDQFPAVHKLSFESQRLSVMLVPQLHMLSSMFFSSWLNFLTFLHGPVGLPRPHSFLCLPAVEPQCLHSAVRSFHSTSYKGGTSSPKLWPNKSYPRLSTCTNNFFRRALCYCVRPHLTGMWSSQGQQTKLFSHILGASWDNTSNPLLLERGFPAEQRQTASGCRILIQGGCGASGWRRCISVIETGPLGTN